MRRVARNLEGFDVSNNSKQISADAHFENCNAKHLTLIVAPWLEWRGELAGVFVGLHYKEIG